MKGNKGITLIALIVTIIVLIILAGVAIAMLSGDNGILNRATDARYQNVLTQVDEQAKLAAMGVKTTIAANGASKAGYTATSADAFYKAGTPPTGVVGEVMSELGVTALNTANAEGFAVYKIDPEGASTALEGYIVITYTTNALRSSLPSDPDEIKILKDLKVDSTYNTRDTACLVYVIKVTNYNSELSNPVLTSQASAATAGSNISALADRVSLGFTI